jgi:hypothetical protein
MACAVCAADVTPWQFLFAEVKDVRRQSVNTINSRVFGECEFMTIAPQPEQVRKLVARVFAEFGVDVGNLLDLNETLLVTSGRYVARSYRAEGLMAMWLLRAGIVQFYDAEGTMLRTVNLLKRLRPHPVAA